MAYTTPKTWTAGEDLTAGELNTHLRDNIAYLYAAKFGHFGRLAALNVPTSTWTAVSWDFAVEQDPTMWSSGSYPERVSPPVAGVWLVTALFRWEATTDTGTRTVRLEKNGSTLLAQVRESNLNNATQYVSATAVVRLNGSGDYINCSVWQNSGSTQTLASSVDRALTLTWMGA